MLTVYIFKYKCVLWPLPFDLIRHTGPCLLLSPFPLLSVLEEGKAREKRCEIGKSHIVL